MDFEVCNFGAFGCWLVLSFGDCTRDIGDYNMIVIV